MTGTIGPISDEYRAQMNHLAAALDGIFNPSAKKTVGFILLQFPFDHPFGAQCNYISNTRNRQDILAMLKEIIARFEGQPGTGGTA